MEPPPLTPSPDNNILNFKKKKPYKSLEGKHVKSATWRKQMNYLSVLAEKWFQPCYELRGCWTPHWIFFIFFLLSLSLSFLSPFLCIWTARSLHYTQGNYWSMEEPLANCSWLIDPEALTPRSVTLVERKPVLLLVVSRLDLCIKTRVFCVLIQPPPFFPQKCVCIYLFKQGFSVY